ncbi:hypothetical protein [Dactylosporangium sp. CA-233914]|uniref:hypothetical protein n=1 Tax=Dactylosporangium sp. CA-233914 TaxID=3239934 RepID=UPI003D8A4157
MPAVVGLAVLAMALYLTGASTAPPDAPAAAVASVSATSAAPAEAAAERVNRELDAQSRALLTGDLDAYLKPVHASLREEFTLRFTSLRALGVAAWTARAAGRPRTEGDGRWSMTVEIRYCLGAADCMPATLRLPSTWSVETGQAVITVFQRTVLPWDLTPLRAVFGRRVIVAGPAETAGRLTHMLAAADQAADIADRYARWDPPPKRYVVFVAPPPQWHTWWNGSTDDIDAYAEGSYGVAIKSDVDRDNGLVNLLTHEFTHVLSLGDTYGAGRDWWLYEGLAEYVADRDGSWTKARLPDVRRFVRSGRWDGTVTLATPPNATTADDRRARYGIALLTVTCLAKRFGEDRMLKFFTAVVRGRSDPPTASPTTLGADWQPIAADCAAEVHTRAT